MTYDGLVDMEVAIANRGVKRRLRGGRQSLFHVRYYIVDVLNLAFLGKCLQMNIERKQLMKRTPVARHCRRWCAYFPATGARMDTRVR